MKILGCTIIILTFCAVPKLQATGLESGNNLLKYCQAAEKNLNGQSLSLEELRNAMMCIGYFEGVLGDHGVYQGANPNYQMIRFCIGDDMPISQGIRVLVKFLREHPEKLQMRGSLLIEVAMSEALPCK